MRAIIIVFILILVSCGSTKENPKNSTQVKENVVLPLTKKGGYDFLIAAQTGGFTNPQIWVIKEPKALQEVYAQINKSKTNKIALPKVDFNTETIVAIFMGEKNTGGYTVNVTSVTETNKEVIVTVKETQPKDSQMVTMALTQPFTIIKINSANKSIKFEK